MCSPCAWDIVDCVQCDTTDPFDLSTLTCSQCSPGLGLTISKLACVPEIPNCEYINDFDNTLCDKCVSGYGFSSTDQTTCVACSTLVEIND